MCLAAFRSTNRKAWSFMGVKHYYQALSLEAGQTVLIPRTDLEQKTIKIDAPISWADAAGRADRDRCLATGHTQTDRSRGPSADGATGGGRRAPTPSMSGITLGCRWDKVFWLRG